MAAAVTQSMTWRLTSTALLHTGVIDGVAITLTIPTGGLQISASGCVFTVSGSQTVLIPNAATMLGALTPAITRLRFASGQGRLVVDNAGALCAFLVIAVGNPAELGGTYALTPSLNGTLVLLVPRG